MLPTYSSSIKSIADRETQETPERLSRRAAIIAVFGLALIAWVPLLVPLIVILHR
jgi:hypothetical protein